jgi:phage replication-related protein YjqB (UPF0714/DUF867 family)
MHKMRRDTYSCFTALAKEKTRDRDYRTVLRETGGRWIILAPHGGGIEPGTSEIAAAIAGSEHALYLFEGLRSSGNQDLHITSTLFDEPQAMHAIPLYPHALAIHGSAATDRTIAVGGGDAPLARTICAALQTCGLPAVMETGTSTGGRSQRNICNMTASGAGVQLEFSHTLRAAMFSSLTRTGRQQHTALFDTVVQCLSSVLRSSPRDPS